MKRNKKRDNNKRKWECRAPGGAEIRCRRSPEIGGRDVADAVVIYYLQGNGIPARFHDRWRWTIPSGFAAAAAFLLSITFKQRHPARAITPSTCSGLIPNSDQISHIRHNELFNPIDSPFAGPNPVRISTYGRTAGNRSVQTI